MKYNNPIAGVVVSIYLKINYPFGPPAGVPFGVNIPPLFNH